MKFENYTIEKFLDELGSDLEAPGGGSTSALVLALAGSLNKMVYSLTIGKKSFHILNDDKKAELEKFNLEGESFIKDSLKLMEEDRSAFKALMEGYKIPKDEEGRKEKLQKLTYDAMNAPLKMAKLGVGFYENIKFAAEYGNKGLITDAGVANILLNSAIESAVLNVRINLKFFNDKKVKENVQKEIEEIIKISDEKKKEIEVLVNKEVM
ncbi:MAG: cyclodeaminase/cyclohydrolase family protein [Clostridium sp.]|uniref:cyclodeaminase/cyclohydrolase family protein n=1 Tax=Clostridium sp. TaxID=1506 RepID=UPI003F38286E